jgi:hypothetical protein
MDEILASIRRIIESNEPVTQSGVATSMAEPEGFSGRPANDDSEEVTLTVDDAFVDRDLDYAPVATTPSVLRAIAEAEAHARSSSLHDSRQSSLDQPAPTPQKSLSLADVAARVRAASERTSVVLRETQAAQTPAVERHAAEMVRPVAEMPVTAAQPLQMEQPLEPQEEFIADERLTSLEPERQPKEEYRPEPISLLSSSAGEQVARSFQDLALAIDHAERRSLDQIAEDMLRPMLQEWLDDNLPTLVERLVREEIERVARSPRR